MGADAVESGAQSPLNALVAALSDMVTHAVLGRTRFSQTSTIAHRTTLPRTLTKQINTIIRASGK